jgi:hypothetical protein
MGHWCGRRNPIQFASFARKALYARKLRAPDPGIA